METTKVTQESDITLDELSDALRTCSDSAPGSDGIPYSVYKTNTQNGKVRRDSINDYMNFMNKENDK